MPIMPATPGTVALTPVMKRPMKMALPPWRWKNSSPWAMSPRWFLNGQTVRIRSFSHQPTK
jgi:hypothetical protein